MEGPNSKKISFGTEGWRAIISGDFTFKNVKFISETIRQIKNDFPKYECVVIGYDNRFLSAKFAGIIADCLGGNNINILLSDASSTTPNLCFSTRKRKNALGFMITSSHNPYFYNGIKIKSSDGGPLSENYTKKVEEKLAKGEISKNYTDNVNLQNIAKTDIREEYISYLKNSINISRIKNTKRPIIFDMLYGPSGYYISSLFRDRKNVLQIRFNRDPLFGGINPEPIEQNLRILKKEVIKNNAAAGIAFDGDGDRLGVIDEKGRYLPPHIVFPLLAYYAVKHKKQYGKILQTISLGYLSKRIAQKFNLPFQETPVGFKHLSSIMLKEKVIAAGEESGGYSICSDIPDRDGIHSGLILLEALSYYKGLSQMVAELKKEFGETSFKRFDVALRETIPDKKIFTQSILNLIPEKINNKIVKKVSDFDGIKILFSDDSWLMLRPSGTEPLIRIYSETESPAETTKLIKYGLKIINKICSFGAK